MADQLQTVSPGQPFRPSASLHNATVDLIRRSALNRANLAGTVGRSAHSTTILPIHNGSGAAIQEGGILAIDGPMFEDDDPEQTPRIAGIKPTSTSAGRIAVLLEPAEKDAVCRAAIAGLAWVKLKISDGDAGIMRADFEEGKTEYLVPMRDGAAEILWPAADAIQPADDPIDAIVRLGSVPNDPVPFALVDRFTWQEGSEMSKATGRELAYDPATGKYKYDDESQPEDLYSVELRNIGISVGRRDQVVYCQRVWGMSNGVFVWWWEVVSTLWPALEPFTIAGQFEYPEDDIPYAPGKHMVWDEGSDDYVEDQNAEDIDLFFYEAYADDQGYVGLPLGWENQSVWCRPMQAMVDGNMTYWWEIVSGDFGGPYKATLDADLVFQDEADATIEVGEGDATTEVSVTVKDRGLLADGQTLPDGAECVVEWSGEDGAFVVVGPSPARLVRATLTEDLVAGQAADATAVVSGDTISVEAWMLPISAEIPSGTKIWAHLEDDGTYELAAVGPQLKTIVISNDTTGHASRVTEDNNAPVVQNFEAVYGLPPITDGSAPSWATWHTGSECEDA